MAAASACACTSAASSSSSAASSASSSACARGIARERAVTGARTRRGRASSLSASLASAAGLLSSAAARGAPGQDALPRGRRIGAGTAHRRPRRVRGRQTASPRRRSRPTTTQTAASATTASRPARRPSWTTSWTIRHACPPRPAVRRREARQGARAPSRTLARAASARAFLLLFFFLVSSKEYTLCATTTGAPPELNMPCARSTPSHVSALSARRRRAGAGRHRFAASRRAGPPRSRRAWCVSRVRSAQIGEAADNKGEHKGA